MRRIDQKPELLAPAGRPEVLRAVIEAGADCVYLGAKRFHMRGHRSDFHFNEEDLAEGLEFAHQRGVRIFVTFNSLLAEDDLPEAEEFLCQLAELGVDAVIIQDLALLEIARRRKLAVELHASTMTNCHSALTALQLKELGVRRVIVSRDIDLAAIGKIGREAGIEVECFIHGDMCACQSGQCYLSGLAMGKSANRGECMKPCRWQFELATQNDQDGERQVTKGYLLAIKDISLLRQIPQIVQEGISCLKIEGRMRDAAYLAHLVGAYRRVIDAYFASPPTFYLVAEETQKIYAERVRDLSALMLDGAAPSPAMFDASGEREPLFLSSGATEPRLSIKAVNAVELPAEHAPDRTPPARVRVAVCVASLAAARAALEAGADRIDLAAEVPQLPQGSGWEARAFDELLSILDKTKDGEGRVATFALRSPRIADERGLAEFEWLLRRFDASSGPQPSEILVHQLGSLRLAQEVQPQTVLVADYGLNVLNSRTAALLAELGATSSTISIEASFSDVAAITAGALANWPLEQPPQFELMVHGPMPGMILEHCIIANALGGGKQGFCRAPCQHMTFTLKDEKGQMRSLWADQHCRNHLTTGSALALLGQLPFLLRQGIGVLRIEGQLDEPRQLAEIVSIYRQALDLALQDLKAQHPVAKESWDQLRQASSAELNLGALAQTVTHSIKTSELMRAERAAAPPRQTAQGDLN